MNEATTPDAAEVDADLSAVTTSERHRLLSTERRRLVLRIFDEKPLPMSLEALADTVAEHEATAGSPRVDTATSVRIALHHQHLPLMDDLGLVDYDADARRINAP